MTSLPSETPTRAARGCPTCSGNGSEGKPFDGHCPASWAHCYLGSLDAVLTLQEQNAALSAELSQMHDDYAELAGAATCSAEGLMSVLKAQKGEPLADVTPQTAQAFESRGVNRLALDAAHVMHVETGRAWLNNRQA